LSVSCLFPTSTFKAEGTFLQSLIFPFAYKN
jgi:hypothetical protein